MKYKFNNIDNKILDFDKIIDILNSENPFRKFYSLNGFLKLYAVTIPELEGNCVMMFYTHGTKSATIRFENNIDEVKKFIKNTLKTRGVFPTQDLLNEIEDDFIKSKKVEIGLRDKFQ